MNYNLNLAMIKINCNLVTETEEKRKRVLETAIELTAFSLHDAGCLEYDIYQSQTNSDRLVIVETWESEEALKAHSESEHFKRLVPRLHENASVIMQRFDF